MRMEMWNLWDKVIKDILKFLETLWRQAFYNETTTTSLTGMFVLAARVQNLRHQQWEAGFVFSTSHCKYVMVRTE